MSDCVIIREGGYFYNVTGNDALLLHEHLGYKLFGKKTFKAGFPVKMLESFKENFEKFSINYSVFSRAGEVVAEREFEDNKYTQLDPANYVQFLSAEKPSAPPVQSEQTEKKCGLSKFTQAVKSVLQEKNPYTDEKITGLDDKLKEDLTCLNEYLEKLQAVIKAANE